MKKFITTCFLITSLGIIFLSGCQNHHEEAHEESASYLVTSPLEKDTFLTKEYVCQIHSIRNIEVRALEKGYLQDIFVDEGKFVRKGTKMFQITPTIYQAELQKAVAEAKFAEIEYLNTKALADSNVVSVNELALAKARLDKANAEIALAQAHLNFTEIKAPFDGIMDRLHAWEGSLVDEGDLLTTFSDNSKMWVYFNVPEAEYLNFATHSMRGDMKHVSLRMANGEFFDQNGAVETIEAEFNNETGNIPFRATFLNPKGILRHGETGNILMTIPLKQALLIPQMATFEILDKKFVYVLDENNEVHSREISVIEELPHLYVVDKGLAPEDKFLMEGLRKVRENDKIVPKFKDPETAISELAVYAE